jgi:riboflavin kinase / FMN adenylyltransferase
MFRLVRDSLGACLAPQGSVVCIGAFDGVHCGHRALLGRVRERADALGVKAVAVSFEPIPREFFARSKPVPRLDNVRGKIQQIRESGIDLLMLMRFNAALAAMPAEDFVEQILIGRLQAREVWVGADFHFGHARRGDVELLREMGVTRGFRAEVFGEFTLDDERVRSSAIRELLGQGDFQSAERLLGRRFSIGGHVVYGKQLGRKYPAGSPYLADQRHLCGPRAWNRRRSVAWRCQSWREADGEWRRTPARGASVRL